MIKLYLVYGRGRFVSIRNKNDVAWGSFLVYKLILLKILLWRGN